MWCQEHSYRVLFKSHYLIPRYMRFKFPPLLCLLQVLISRNSTPPIMLPGLAKCRPRDLSMALIRNPLLHHLPLNQSSLLKKPGSPRQTKLLDGYTSWWNQNNEFTLTIGRILFTCGIPFTPYTSKCVLVLDLMHMMICSTSGKLRMSLYSL